MAAHDKRSQRNTRNLRRRLKYHGLDLPTNTKEERAKARGALVKKKNRDKAQRATIRLNKTIKIYNEMQGENARHKFFLGPRVVGELTKKQKQDLQRSLTRLNKRKNVMKEREKLADHLRVIAGKRPQKSNGNNKKQVKKGPQTINVLSSNIENKYRKKHGELTLLEETYYTNFKKACLRKGLFALYRRAAKNGYGYVRSLYAKGFDINDIYEHYEEGVIDEYYTDAQIDGFLAGETKIPQKSSEIWRYLQARYKIR